MDIYMDETAALLPILVMVVIIITYFVWHSKTVNFPAKIISYCKKYKSQKSYHKNKEWRNIIYGIITQKTNDIPVISTDDALFGKETAFDNSLIESYYEKRDYPVDNSISKHTKPDGEVFYDIRGRAFNRLDIEYFMKLNDIKPIELFYAHDKYNYGNYNMYYRLNGKYFELACGRFDGGAINIGLFEIAEVEYEMQKSESAAKRT